MTAQPIWMTPEEVSTVLDPYISPEQLRVVIAALRAIGWAVGAPCGPDVQPGS